MAAYQIVVLCALAFASVYSDCHFEGKTYTSGAKFTLPEHDGKHGKCIEYTCTDGSVAPSKKECLLLRTNECKPIGNVDEFKCVKQVCTENADGAIGFKIESQRCLGLDDQCFDLGSVFAVKYAGSLWSKSTCVKTDAGLYYSYRN